MTEIGLYLAMSAGYVDDSLAAGNCPDPVLRVLEDHRNTRRLGLYTPTDLNDDRIAEIRSGAHKIGARKSHTTQVKGGDAELVRQALLDAHTKVGDTMPEIKEEQFIPKNDTTVLFLASPETDPDILEEPAIASLGLLVPTLIAVWTNSALAREVTDTGNRIIGLHGHDTSRKLEANLFNAHGVHLS